ncbi:uncharacterized protein TRIADDRAFT_53526 [Trichoplax adhaerens]|uniref:Ion transport domain-containing protein n=1 Tax=Trichoplax adhaerens TaxID=10228 RepID=B3RPG4_TRIAD|nr:hypothetical protein TRIADDRAFT_53526 [Trichoplax adhaerens]EDV27630.1 hypothetical protein TRIADDRAFT_53526 [Trichoplax adhaerens]|eukprot:XP_002109464.1 hypothetical protein TRIADDRAFT_53526 [Trichoplax adhaerens]
MEIFMYISTLILITPPGRVPNDWQWLFGSFALFLSWINLLLFMERISALGIYVIMLKSVLLTFLRILVVLTIFMVAFAFAFTILAGSEDVFSTISLAMIKVLDMMVGEIDYKDVFVTAISGRTIKYPDNYVLVAFLVIFIFLMPILLMNLMIGLAIGDIDKIQRNANIRRLGIQIDFLDDLERSLPRWLRKKFHCVKDIRNTQKYLYKFYAYVYGEVTSKNEEDVEEFYIEQIDRVLTELDWQKKQIRGIFTEMDKMMETILEIQSFQEFSHHAPKGGSMQSEDSKKSEGPKALLSPEASDTSDEKTYL